MMSSNRIAKNKLYWDIFDRKRLSIIPKLKFLKRYGFYLAGGTALALQIRHRISVDFDFYNQNKFDSEEILIKFQNISKRAILIQKALDTLVIKVEGIEISLFTYTYRLLKSLIDSKYISVASLEDIAAMKLIAIIQRGIQRDFIDLYFLIKRLGLMKIFQLTQKKYPPFNKYVGMQAVTYFNDAERTPLKRKLILFEDVSWNQMKEFIVAETKKIKKRL